MKKYSNDSKISNKKCVAFGTGKTNLKFGGIDRKGQEDIFYQMKKIVWMMKLKMSAALLVFVTTQFDIFLVGLNLIWK
uniref:Transmembrane protein n=1 Tax=Octopus bimaculoides TaxID=37653 RepID=A0A0L8HKY6_OCTBM